MKNSRVLIRIVNLKKSEPDPQHCLFSTDLCRDTETCCCWHPRPAGWRTYAVLQIRIPDPNPIFLMA
jgi:hypothetical protein